MLYKYVGICSCVFMFRFRCKKHKTSALINSSLDDSLIAACQGALESTVEFFILFLVGLLADSPTSFLEREISPAELRIEISLAMSHSIYFQILGTWKNS